MPDVFDELPDVFDQLTQTKASVKGDIFDDLRPDESEILSRPAIPAALSNTEAGLPEPEPSTAAQILEGPSQMLDAGRQILTHPVSSLARSAETAASMIADHPMQITIPGTRQALGLEGAPPLQIPRISERKSTLGKLAAGAANAGIEFANYFLTPDGFAALGAGGLPSAAQKGVAIAFGTEMAAQAPQQYNAAIESAKKGDWQSFAENTASFAGGTALGAHLIKTGVIKPERIKVGEREYKAYEMPPEATEADVPQGKVVPDEPKPTEASAPVEEPPPIPVETPVPERPGTSEEVPIAPEGEPLPFKIESYGEKYVREHGVEAAQARIRHLQSRAQEEANRGTIRQSENLIDEWENIAKALQPDQVPPIEPAVPPDATKPPNIGPGAASPLEFIERKTLDFSNELLPDFLPREKETAIFSEPYAAGQIPVLGKVIDPNARITNAEQQSLAAYHAARQGVGPARASYIGSRYGTEIRNAFKASENGDLNVAPTKEGQSLKISDIFEALQRNPKSYTLDAEQQRVWNEVLKPILDAKQKLVSKYELVGTMDAEGNPVAHFHRIVTDFPKGKEPTIRRIGQMVGAKIPSQRGRVFERSEQQGWEKGYKYELDPVKRLVSDIERTYKAIADKRLINDPIFGGKTPKALEAQLREAFSEELASGDISEKAFRNIVENRAAQGRVYQPGYSNTIFEPETAKLLNDALQTGDARWRRVFATGNDFLKAMMLGFDLGVGQLQLLPTFFRNPGIWAKSNWEAMKAMFKPESFSEYLKVHEQAAKELSEAGSSIGQVQEFMAGVRPGQAITRIPVVGAAAKAFGRQFQTALDVAKIQLWEAWREMTPPNERLQTIRSIESQLNIGRMESIGVNGGQALLERTFLLAPSYYRGAINLVAAIGEKGVSGKIARQAITAYVGGGLALFYGVGKMLGMDDKEMLKRLDPSRPEFLQWNIEGANGHRINIGIGGIHRSLLRLAGNMVRTSIDHPGNWASLSMDKNPITRWLRGHLAIMPERIFTALSGKDFMGEESDLTAIGKGTLPLTFQQFFRRQGEPRVTVAELAASFTGLNAYPEQVQRQFVRQREDLSKERFGKQFEELPLRQQLAVTQELDKQAPFNEKVPATAKQIEQAFKHSVDRLQRITKGLPKNIQESISDAGLHVTGYEPSLAFGKQRLLLTQKQQERYEALITEEYSRILPKVNFSNLKRLDIEQRQKVFNRYLEGAKLRARARFLSEMHR